MKNIILALCLLFFVMPVLADDVELNNDEQEQKIETVKVGNFSYSTPVDSTDENSQETIRTQIQNNQGMPIRPEWQETAPVEIANIKYQAAIVRPKWAVPLAIIAEIGTLGIFPAASAMKNEDRRIEANNRLYDTYQQYKKRFDGELAQCETLFNSPQERYVCFTNVKTATQINLNSMTRNRELANQTALQKKQVALQRAQLGQQIYNNNLVNEQNRLIRQQNSLMSMPRTYTMTTTRVGNYTYSTINH